jgi:hypothetical protein
MATGPAHRSVKGGRTRLAIRSEGGRVNAYLAAPDSMDGALLVGSILRGADEDLRNDWKTAIQLWLMRVIAECTGAPPAALDVEELPDA